MTPTALHKKSWAVIDRPYSLGYATVGALYERPRCIFCAKPTPTVFQLRLPVLIERRYSIENNTHA